MIPLVTEGLILRAWREEDKPLSAAINADSVAMEHFPELLTRAQSDALVDRFLASLADWDMTMFAAEEKASSRFVGVIGL